jgi:hypothetical protein
LAQDEFGDDDRDEAPRSVPRPPKRKQKNKSSNSGKPPPGEGGRQPEQPAKAPSPVVVYGLLAVIMVPVLGFAIFMAVRQGRMQKGQDAAFAAEIDQLLRAPKEGAPPPGKPGRFAEIDVDERALTGSHHSLWEDMRAATPAEADYIVHVHTIRETVSTYTDGSKGIKVTLELTVIDKPTWTVMGRKTFVGSDPSLVALGSHSDVIGTPPDRQEVIAYYRGLVGMK